jgi:hypothetical protein
VTWDDGGTWQNVTPPDMTAWTKVVMIEASHFDAMTAYAAAERHQLEDYEPHVYRTRDGGKTWQPIVKGLPPGVYVQTVKEDPERRGLLFCGTERAVFVSFDDGVRGSRAILPATSMRSCDQGTTSRSRPRPELLVPTACACGRSTEGGRVRRFCFVRAPPRCAGARRRGTPLPKD